ncbi:Tubulin/FtsZ family, GTPase domain-containing protein [Chytriomyces sp. MP71]|nr:Tubulin/FtsZ family, GTPase domain-containing protein [Chytriomyces sp. MP71]
MILLQVGQCGIQVGQSLAQLLEAEDCLMDRILVDTERKTLPPNPTATRNTRLTIVDAGTAGRGNNWAHGYSDDAGAEKTIEALRRSVEAETDACWDPVAIGPGVLLVQSIAGGTGSGLGSRLTEDIRDEYPKRFLWNCAISPFASGETALQHYNSLLSLSTLQRNSDLISLFSNDILLNTVAKQHALVKGNARGDPKVTLNEINEQIAHTLAGVLLPVSPVFQNGDGELRHCPMRGFSGFDLITQVAPLPACKISSLATSINVVGEDADRRRATSKGIIPAIGWEDLTTDLMRNMASAPLAQKRSHISSRLYARNAVGPEFWSRADKMDAKIKQKLGASVVSPPAQDLELFASSTFGMNPKSAQRSLTLVSNDSDIIPSLSHLLDRARTMHASGAYLHWYDRHYIRHHAFARPFHVPEGRGTKNGWDSTVDVLGLEDRRRLRLGERWEDRAEDLVPWPWTWREGERLWSAKDWEVEGLFDEAFECIEGVLEDYKEFCTV